MFGRFSFSKKRIIAVVCCSLFPVLSFLWGIFVLLLRVKIDILGVIAFFFIPIVAILFLAVIIFDKDTLASKIILSSVIMILFVVSSLYFSIGTTYTRVRCYKGNDVKEKYSVVETKMNLMPKLSEIGTPENILYYNVSKGAAIFSWEIDYLVCDYNQTEFEEQKQKFEEKFVFQNEIIKNYEGNCEPQIEMDGYLIRTLSLGEVYKDSLYWPKRVMFIATSQEENRIIYIFAEDNDLDYIVSLEDYLLRNCGWKHIKK